MDRRYQTDTIRELLTEGYEYEALRNFCFDKPNFRPVFYRLAPNTGKSDIIQYLIEHAEQYSYFDILLDWAKEKNPARYAMYKLYWDEFQLSTPEVPKPPKSTKFSKHQFIYAAIGISLLIAVVVVFTNLGSGILGKSKPSSTQAATTALTETPTQAISSSEISDVPAPTPTQPAIIAAATSPPIPTETVLPTSTKTPLPSPSPKPTQTIFPTATPKPTNPPSQTPSPVPPTVVPSSTPSLLPTETPTSSNSSSMVINTPTPTTVPTAVTTTQSPEYLYPAPVLIEPANQAYYVGLDVEIVLTWQHIEFQNVADQYVVTTIRHVDQTKVYEDYQLKTEPKLIVPRYIYDTIKGGRDVTWFVRVIRNGRLGGDQNNVLLGDFVSPPSETRSFIWDPVNGGNGNDPNPGKKPNPPN